MSIGTRPDNPPGSPAPGLADTPSASCGQARDDDGWTPFLNLGEITALTRPPATWRDLVEFCCELVELDALCKDEGISWTDPVEPMPDAPQAGQDGPRKVPGHRPGTEPLQAATIDRSGGLRLGGR